jgi:hypothetical protein
MRSIPLLVGALLSASTGNAIHAQCCVGDHKPAPLDMVEQMTLPLCDFAATQSLGPKGCQWCDARKMPKPFGSQAIPQNETSRFRGLPEINCPALAALLGMSRCHQRELWRDRRCAAQTGWRARLRVGPAAAPCRLILKRKSTDDSRARAAMSEH